MKLPKSERNKIAGKESHFNLAVIHGDVTEDIQVLKSINYGDKCSPEEYIQKKKDEVTKLLLSFPEKLQNCNDPDTVQAILTHMTQIDGLCNAVSMLPSGSSSRSSLPVDPTTVNEPVNDCQASVIAFNQKKR